MTFNLGGRGRECQSRGLLGQSQLPLHMWLDRQEHRPRPGVASGSLFGPEGGPVGLESKLGGTERGGNN